MPTISLRCKSCGGIMVADGGREIVSCPYCGSKELIEDSDEVKKSKAWYKTYEHLEAIRVEDERKKRQDELLEKKRNEKIGTYMLIGLAVFLLIVYILSR